MNGFTYAKVGGPPDCWQWLKIQNIDSGEFVENVIEINTVDKWLVRYKPDDLSNTEVLRGNFQIIRSD